ncbi:tyrosine-type recombinase/integrase [Paraburkholderia hospita]|uniref:tyrosine-type recombinase/integrase n=1 Tax=Paraburkholderia hospita TaxID=169430 RepID=UPI0013750649
MDWAGGVIHIRGTKSRRDLPLLRDVGHALLAYINRERPSSSDRTIFLQAVTPARPLTDSSAISKIVRHALKRADIAPARGAAHLLRHAAATTMLTRGMSFKNIADVLGHQSLQSTLQPGRDGRGGRCGKKQSERLNESCIGVDWSDCRGSRESCKSSESGEAMIRRNATAAWS